LDDVFAKDSRWRKFATDFCIAKLHDDFEAQGAPDPDREAVEAVVGHGDNWLWGADAATVHFTVYTVASFSGGESDVRIPYSVLAPYLRADAPVSMAVAKP
ncbi:MAG: RsiV family protein, partial [Rhodanobacteraceae bacterium]